MFGIVKDAVKIIVGTGLGYSCKDWKPDTIIPHEVSERPGLGYSCKDWKHGMAVWRGSIVSCLGYSCKDWKQACRGRYVARGKVLRIFL